MRIGIIGVGRLGSSLAVALAHAGYPLRAVASRDRAQVKAIVQIAGHEVRAGTPEEVAGGTDLVFLTVPDRVITPLAAALPWRPGQWAVHCSGASDLDVLVPAFDAGASTGCLHPLQSFSARVPEPGRFAGISCGIEGAAELAGYLEQLTCDLGANPFRLEGIDRALYHVSAVFTSNYAVALMAAARRAWSASGLPPQAAQRALSPLLMSTASNIRQAELDQTLTGPVARGDAVTVKRHLRALSSDPGLEHLYRELALELLRIAPTIGGGRRAALESLLGAR